MEGEENESSGVSISVIDTEIRSDKLTKHVRYSISGKDASGPFACLRRYKEFAALRQVLVILWPGCYVPQIPQKQIMGNLAQDFIQIRRRLLDYFLKQISQLDYLYSCEGFQTFIRGPVDYIKTTQDLRSMSFIQISQILRDRFSNYSEFHVTQEHESQLEDASQYFKTGLEALEKFEKVCKENYDNYNELKSDVKNLMVGVKEISLFYAEKYGGSPVNILEAEGNSNPYEDLLYWTQQDMLDLRAIIDALITRQFVSKMKLRIGEKLEAEKAKLAKLQSGKKSLGQIFSKKSKEDHVSAVESEIKKCEEEIESCNKIVQVVTGRLIEEVIVEFKQYKTENFENKMKSFIDASLKDYNHFINEAKHLESNLN